MQIRTIASVAGLLVSASLAFATSAQAASFNSSDKPGNFDNFDMYPLFPYEGKYPEATPCRYNYKLVQSKTVNWGGRNITLSYFYSDGCGSYARIDNAPRECAVYLDRTEGTEYGVTDRWAFVGETVDAGISFAYTMVGNNLSGRLSRGALLCNGTFVTNTNWY